MDLNVEDRRIPVSPLLKNLVSSSLESTLSPARLSFLLNKVDGAVFGFEVGFGEIGAEDARDEELETTKEDDDAHERRPTADGVAVDERPPNHEQECEEGHEATAYAEHSRHLQRGRREGHNTIKTVAKALPKRPLGLAGLPLNIGIRNPMRLEAYPLINPLRKPIDL